MSQTSHLFFACLIRTLQEALHLAEHIVYLPRAGYICELILFVGAKLIYDTIHSVFIVYEVFTESQIICRGLFPSKTNRPGN